MSDKIENMENENRTDRSEKLDMTTAKKKAQTVSYTHLDVYKRQPKRK